MFNYLIVGSGLYVATFAQQAHAAGKSVLVIDKRPHIAGNVYTERVEGINVHKYGAHIIFRSNIISGRQHNAVCLKLYVCGSWQQQKPYEYPISEMLIKMINISEGADSGIF